MEVYLQPMEAFHIEESKKSPRIVMDPKKGLFEIKGRSFPENVMGFYQPLIDWLDEYAKTPNSETEFAFRYTYHNSATHKVIYNILQRLQKVQESGAKVLIHWEYSEGDEDIHLEGEDFSRTMGLPFELVEVPN